MQLDRAFPFFSMFFGEVIRFCFRSISIGDIGVVSDESLINLLAFEQRVEQIQWLSSANTEAILNMWVPSSIAIFFQQSDRRKSSANTSSTRL